MEVVQVKGKVLQFGSEWDYGIGGAVWPVARILCQHLQDPAYPENFWNGKKVIELGSGTGICGIVCALLGANVTLTDIGKHIDLLKQNVQENAGDAAERIQVFEYPWGKERAELGWLDASYDFILGSDIIYDANYFDDLIQSLLELSSAKTVTLLAFQKRDPADLMLFFHKLGHHFRYVKVPTTADIELGVVAITRRIQENNSSLFDDLHSLPPHASALYSSA
eukprot:TRINITY_DN1552_c0_g1_i1.p1 TRINITY_DN1552_c0_g1~~TRINITY_DN1552_c0_g1_i1.p1  ORF type:complete len:223 (+),score=31.94 TRINITY_DN1552_c0_g1_i1:113-781(+)